MVFIQYPGGEVLFLLDVQTSPARIFILSQLDSRMLRIIDRISELLENSLDAGARRIVVVRQGTVTSWTPTDGTAPSGVSTNYMAAMDLGSGNKICYDGSDHTFRLTGLGTNLTYSFKIFEYNGTGSSVNYLTSGAPATGNQSTSN